MKRLAAILFLLFCAGWAHAQGSTPNLVNCDNTPLVVPCTSAGGPGDTGTGDPAWRAFGKINENFTASYNSIGVANPILSYGANGDTVFLHATGVFNSTAGQNNVSFGRAIGGNFAGATIVITGCGPLVAVPPIVVTNGGTGYVVGDTVTLTGGLVLTVTWVNA